MKNLMENQDIVIKNADKRGGVVILDWGDYLLESLRVLSNSHYYKPLSKDPTPEFQKTYTELVINFLLIKNPVMPLFHYLTKMHKILTSPPRCQIISGIGSLTRKLSQYVDLNLQQYVKELPSYLKDITSVINVVQDIK